MDVRDFNRVTSLIYLLDLPIVTHLPSSSHVGLTKACTLITCAARALAN